MKTTIISALAMAFLLFSCGNRGTSEKASSKQVVQKDYVPVTITPGTVEYITLNDSISQMLLARGRKIAGTAKVALKVELKKAIAEGGLEHAVEFCHTRAMEITDSISLAEQVIIKRLAKKNRNPYNAANEEESTIFKGYILNWISSLPLQSMVSWDDEGRPVYYNPIMTEAVCLNCHGTVGEEVNPELAEKIAQLYPEDKAVGFKLREIRGMWSITFPEYMVVAAE